MIDSDWQVVEMYSSGGDLHLELPTGEKEAPKNLWVSEVEVYPLITQISFMKGSNHGRFIDIVRMADILSGLLIIS